MEVTAHSHHMANANPPQPSFSSTGRGW